MDDMNGDDDEPRRGFSRIFRRVIWMLRYCAVNFCSCRFVVSFFILICSMALLHILCNDPGSSRRNHNPLRNSTDSLTNLADFEAGTLVRRRNFNNTDALTRMLDGDPEILMCDSVNITTMLSILDDAIPRECVHIDVAAGSETLCLQCARDRFKELCEQQACELQSYDRLHTIHPIPDKRTCLLSRDNKDACNSIGSENLQLHLNDKNNSSVENFESGGAGISKPNIDQVDERQNNTCHDISVVSSDSLDGLDVNEANIRGLDCDGSLFHDIPYLNLEREINAPHLQDAERAANDPPQDLGLRVIAPTLLGTTGSLDATQRDILGPPDPIQTYHEVLSRIRNLINLPYQNQCSNASNVRNLESPSYKRYKTEQPSLGTGAIPKNRDAISPAMQLESPAMQQGQESPSRATGAIPKNWEVIRKLREDAEGGGQSRSVQAHSSSSVSISHSRYVDSVMASPCVEEMPRNVDVNQPRNDGQSLTSDLNYWSFEMPLISRVTDHETASSHGRRRHYAGNVLRAAGDLTPRLILLADEDSKDDDDAVVE